MNRDEVVANAIYFLHFCSLYLFSLDAPFQRKMGEMHLPAGFFYTETMSFRAEMHRDEVVENDISFIFVLDTSSSRLHRFRDF